MRPSSLVDSSYHYLLPGLVLGIEVVDITVCEFIIKSSFTHFVFQKELGTGGWSEELSTFMTSTREP